MWGCPADWRWVRDLLEAHGVEVLAPDLPSHRLAGAGLLDDVEKVKSAIRSATRTPVVMAGWSYGCDVAGVAADAGGIWRLVYVSSVPQPVQPAVRADTLFDGSPSMDWDAEGRFVPRDGWWNDDGMHFSSGVSAHFEAHPRRPATRRTLSDPVLAAGWTRVPTTVLLGERDVFNGEQPWARARDRVEDVRVVDCDHFIPFSHPDLVAEVILEGVPRTG
jgi:pimeloyl-ACP methyl ester carboxylesterase